MISFSFADDKGVRRNMEVLDRRLHLVWEKRGTLMCILVYKVR